MKSAAPNIEPELRGFGKLAQLETRARHAETLEELAFITVNETNALAPYRQAVLWRRDQPGVGRVLAISGAATIEQNAPFSLWIERVFARIDRSFGEGAKLCAVEASNLPAELAEEWSEWFPARGLMIPLRTPRGEVLGHLLLVREQPWLEGDGQLLELLGDCYAHAWAALRGGRSRLGHALRGPRRAIKLGLLVAVFAIMWLPVTQSNLAPAEVIPLNPIVVRAPIDGIVERIDVQPNQPVKEGDELLELDSTSIRNRLDVARHALAVAEAEYRQASQQAVFDDKSRVQLAILKGRIEERQAEVRYAMALLDRIHVHATRAGIAVYDDPNDWRGRPVTIGERILTIADPQQAELEIWLPVADAVALAPGSLVTLFLNIAPEDSVSAVVTYAGYEAAISPEGILAYRLKARFTDAGLPPRIGLRGTAKIFGKRVSLFYYLMRRPLLVARQSLGF